jgi:hypothetical protein
MVFKESEEMEEWMNKGNNNKFLSSNVLRIIGGWKIRTYSDSQPMIEEEEE